MADRSHRLATLCRQLVVLLGPDRAARPAHRRDCHGGDFLAGRAAPAWNTVGAPIASAPTADLPTVQAMCRVQERTAANAEERRVAAKGWLLEGYWPTLRQGNTAVVLALAMYDGMSRPLSFNAFAFANGTFAGTLSPVLMNSHTDGVFPGTPGFLPDGRIGAVYPVRRDRSTLLPFPSVGSGELQAREWRCPGRCHGTRCPGPVPSQDWRSHLASRARWRRPGQSAWRYPLAPEEVGAA